MKETKRIEEAIAVAEAIQEKKDTNRVLYYEPYEYQKKFHEARDSGGRLARQRLLMAANKVGKTYSGAMELTLHALGDAYPDWWKGPRFTRPIKAWAAGNTTNNTRDIVQAELLGEPGDEEDFGHGTIPRDRIVGFERAPGIPKAFQSVLIKHKSGKNSKIWFKSYEQGPQAWMGKALDVIWLDEEPPQDIYSQALRGTLKAGGLVYMTFTPESGMTNVVAQFINELKPHQGLFHATWDDAPHLSKDVRDEILAALPPHEREMRSKGVPVLGSGLVFPFPEDQIKMPAFQIPEYYHRICAIDFGWTHPTACVWIACDTENDKMYVYDIHKQAAETPVIHADAIKSRGEWIPCAWPHDGEQHDKGSGKPLAEQYRRLGVNMLGKHFENPDGGQAVEPGIMDILQRMQSGRFKVFEHLTDWFNEYRMYHRKDGKIVKERDDLMSATRYACMSKRFGRAIFMSHGRPAVAIGGLDKEYPYFQEWTHKGSYGIR